MKENMNALNYTFTITTGDEGGDGHSITEIESFSSNFSFKTVHEAYTKASVEFKLNLTDQCEEYEDSKLSLEFYQTFLEVFKDNQDVLEILDETEDDEEGPCLDSDTFAELYLQIAKLNIPELQWKSCPRDDIFIGGYGLFGC